jgi:23S rRNA-/tRNA-specific pseudouridylate synthase
MPIHAAGRYRHNTILLWLARECGYIGLHTVHRLDRLTSGVLVLGKTVSYARALSASLRTFDGPRRVRKTYYARVLGEFPEGELCVDEPLAVVAMHSGVVHVDKDGKPCKTTFWRVSYDGFTSLVKCMPWQGRTHQIRAHLVSFLFFFVLSVSDCYVISV